MAEHDGGCATTLGLSQEGLPSGLARTLGEPTPALKIEPSLEMRQPTLVREICHGCGLLCGLRTQAVVDVTEHETYPQAATQPLKQADRCHRISAA